MFKSTQIGWAVIFIIIGIMIIVAFTVEIATVKVVASVAVVILLLTFRLTITIDQNWVRFSMGIGLIQGKYAIKNIVECRSVDYLPLGWGIRFRPGRIIFNVSGYKAIELTIRGKSMKVLIGTDDPDTLVKIIREIQRKQS